MKLIFLGPPGAGKGTMAARVKDYLQVPHISTGDLFRENVSGGTPLGLQVKAILDRGDLVTDDITVAMVKDRLGRPDAAKGFILDGFPRTVVQAEALAGFETVDAVLRLDCSREELVTRLTGRRQCPVCKRIYHISSMPPAVSGRCDDDNAELMIRDDDKPEAVENRLNVYEELTKPLIDWYSDLIRSVNGSQSPDKVFEDIKTVLKV